MPMPERWRTSALVAVTALLALGVPALTGSWSGDGSTAGAGAAAVVRTSETVATVGQQAPGFTARDIMGREVSLASLEGQGVWLSFGATWCAPCRAEAPDLEALSREFADRRVRLVAVFSGESKEAVAGFAERLGVHYTQIADPESELTASYGAFALPRHVFIDARGVIRSIRFGVLTRESARQELAALS